VWRDTGGAVIDGKDSGGSDEPASSPSMPSPSSNVFGLDGRKLDVEGADWTIRLTIDAQKRIVGSVSNIELILTHDENWKGAFWFDEFTQSIAIRREVPFKIDRKWSDGHEKKLLIWLQREPHYVAGLTSETVRDAIRAIVEDNRFHSFRAELDALVWDGVPRIDTWLSTYAEAVDTDFARLVGPKFLISMVARQYEPGCQVDTVLVFEGAQGDRKSSVCRALAGPDRFFDDMINIESRDTATVLCGKAIVEIQELSRVTRNPKANEAFKVFVRKREDEHVHKWERHSRQWKRSFVMMATVNPDSYLCDETGTRTVWPIPVEKKVSTHAIDQDRDQLLAESVMRFKWYRHLRSELPKYADYDDLPTEVRWWLVGDETRVAKEEQAKRFELGVWDSQIRSMIANVNHVSIDEILREIDPKIERWTQGHKREVVKVLLHLGWVRRRYGSTHCRAWRYWRPSMWKEIQNLPTSKSQRNSSMEIINDENVNESDE